MSENNTCATCDFWIHYSEERGRCYFLRKKVVPDIIFEGGPLYVDGFLTEPDFGCNLHENKSEVSAIG